MRRHRIRLPLCLLVSLQTVSLPGQDRATYIREHYTKYETEIPMRDGVGCKYHSGVSDGSKNRGTPGRPRIFQEIIDLVIRFIEENPRWGYRRIRDYIVHLGYTIGETRVGSSVLSVSVDC